MLNIIKHPIVDNKITILRDENTGNRQFREIVEEIATILCYEATKNVETVNTIVNTPIQQTECKMVVDKFSVVPILRAGIGMVNGILEFLPFAKVGHIGIFREPDTLQPKQYYCKLPHNNGYKQKVLIVDPMLATGGTASVAIQCVRDLGIDQSDIKFLCIVSAPEGVERLHNDHPYVEIFTAAHDLKLNEKGYIVPGLGDAGDRMFGTK